MKRLAYIAFIAGYIFTGCSGDSTTNDSIEYYSESNDQTKGEALITSNNNASSVSRLTKTIGEVNYKVNALTAVDYLARKGEHIASSDYDNISKESVFMLEFSVDDLHKKILENESIQLSKDDAATYFVGDVQKDFTIIQSGHEYKPNGVMYEGTNGKQNTIRLTFFLKDIDVHRNYSVEYYDRLFGKGLVKLSSIKNEIIS